MGRGGFDQAEFCRAGFGQYGSSYGYCAPDDRNYRQLIERRVPGRGSGVPACTFVARSGVGWPPGRCAFGINRKGAQLKGDPGTTSVSVRMIGKNTLEETDIRIAPRFDHG